MGFELKGKVGVGPGRAGVGGGEGQGGVRWGGVGWFWNLTQLATVWGEGEVVGAVGWDGRRDVQGGTWLNR